MGLLGKTAKAAKGLLMDTPSRMARAKEQGFDTDTPMYHGTGNLDKLTAFDRSLTGQGADQFGAGFYTTSDNLDASGYAMDGYRGQGKFKSTSQGVAPLYSKPSNLLEVDGLKSNNLGDVLTLDYDQTKKMLSESPALRRGIDDEDMNPLGDYYDSFWESGPEEWMVDDLAEQYAGRNPEELSDLFDDPDQFLKSLSDVSGYDGIKVNYKDRIHEVHWKPENLRSTNARFDPAKTGSSNLLASNPVATTGAGILGLGAAAQSNDTYADYSPSNLARLRSDDVGGYQAPQSMAAANIAGLMGNVNKVGYDDPLLGMVASQLPSELINKIAYNDKRGLLDYAKAYAGLLGF